MYYEEKWIDGKLYVKTTPTGSWTIKQPTLADLRDAVEYRNISIVDALDMAFSLGAMRVQGLK